MLQKTIESNRKHCILKLVQSVAPTCSRFYASRVKIYRVRSEREFSDKFLIRLPFVCFYPLLTVIMVLRHGSLSRRDAFLLLLGASMMQIWSILFSQPQPQTIFIDNTPPAPAIEHDHTIIRTQIQLQTVTQTTTAAVATESAIVAYGDLPGTSVLAHAPGWTIFQDLYMSNGTLYLVADESRRSKFPEIRKMASHPLEARNTPENIAAREPSDVDMTFITPEEAQRRWGNRVFSVEGNTVSLFFVVCHRPI